MSQLLPLFPLDVVLFPGTPLPLHIFEPRYKELIGECLNQKIPFGVVRAQEEGLAEVGCTADILDVTKRYDDGRMDIVTAGRRRFELVELNEERSYLQAEVMFFDDESSEAPKEKVDRAVELYSELASVVGAEVEAPEAQGPLVSFQIAAPLPLDLDFKQTLLAMRSEDQRLVAIIEYFEALVPKMRRVMHVRQRAGGNGHAL
jgi:Lon protease-like protein